MESEDSFDLLLLKHPDWKTIRINAWPSRFIHNWKVSKQLQSVRPLTTVEKEQQVKWWIPSVQERYSKTENFQEDEARLNLQKNDDEIYKSRDRIHGTYPVHLPPKVALSEKIVQDDHESKDGEIRAARLKTGKSCIERAIHLLCPMELSFAIVKEQDQLDPQVKEFILKQAMRWLKKDVYEKWFWMKQSGGLRKADC